MPVNGKRDPRRILFGILGWSLIGIGGIEAAPIDARDLAFFENKVRPILVEKCESCHSTRAKKLRGGLFLDSREGWSRGGESGPAIIPGDPQKSLVIQAIRYQNSELEMPPSGKLPDDAIAVLTEWVRRGAPDPRTAPASGAAHTRSQGIDLEAGRTHWAFQPLKVVDPPEVNDRNWCKNPIDRFILARLEARGLKPNHPLAPDRFLRRLSLDLTGQQPTPQDVREFVADQDPQKRTKLIDKLLSKPEFVLFWRIKLGDLLQISQARQGDTVYRYLSWIDQSLRQNRPWDELVRTLLTSVGNPADIETGGPVNYALDSPDPSVQAEQAALRFLGLRLRCAQCHDHPFDVWTQDDYYGLAAFFAKVERGGMASGMMAGRTRVGINPDGKVLHLRTGKPTQPRLLDHKTVDLPPNEDPRKAFAAWLVSPENPYFARAMANWTWAQLFGKGIVDPPDDMSRANPPVHPELLDALARDFVSHKFDLRHLIRTIAMSETYGLSSATVPGNEHDQRLFSHHIPRPLSAHQMADALAQATDVLNVYSDRNRVVSLKERRRSIDFNDAAAVESPILEAFGRCDRSTVCAAVSAPPLSLRQSLLLIGGDLIESKVTSLNGYLANALKLELEPEELVENLYYRTVCRPPSPEELSRWVSELKQAPSLAEAAEDLFWSLLNSREFAFNH